MDWLSFWLPWEGTATLAGAAVDHDVPTCGLDELVGDLLRRLRPTAWGFAVVLNEAGVVIGVLEEHGVDPEARAEEGMVFGPTTVRPSEDLKGLIGRMARARVEALLVTSSDRRLLGVLRRSAGDNLLGDEARG